MGYGDSIMVTGIAKAIKKKYPDYQIIIGNKTDILSYYDPAIFINNPNIAAESDIDLSKKTIWIEEYQGKRSYVKNADKEKFYWNEKYRAIPGELYFTAKEINSAKSIFNKIEKTPSYRFKKKIIFIEPSRNTTHKNADSNNGEENKRWVLKRWQDVVNYFNHEILFVQSTYKNCEILEGTHSFNLNFREACALMSLCDFYLGWEGGFSHAAAALNKKGIVLFGGYIHPQTTGYNLHENIYVDISGSPCGMRKYCTHCEKCRKLITVEQVVEKIKKILVN